MAHTDNPEGPDPDPEVDCKCYMRVIGVENLELSNYWKLITGGDIFANGLQSFWNEPGTFNPSWPLPSPFVELPPPSNGWHSFILEFIGEAPAGALLHTEVRCYLQNGDDTETLMTTTYHTFDFWEGFISPPLDPESARSFNKFFSCLYQTADPPPRN